jgi:hypothetical protein
MSKGKSITLLSIVSVLVAIMLVMTFIRFPIGIHNYNSVLGAIELDYDVDGGTAYTLKLSKDNIKDVEDIDEVVKTIDYRLGELGYDQLRVAAFDHSTRKLTKVSIEDAINADKMTSLLMGGRVEGRKNLIVKEAKYANLM